VDWKPTRSYETEVQLDESDGMLAACALSLDNTFLAEKAMLGERITALGPAKMDEVCRALDAATGC
jgi:mRNA-degrading endonuclease toxin of MazEF toxin-antitoxin module